MGFDSNGRSIYSGRQTDRLAGCLTCRLGTWVNGVALRHAGQLTVLLVGWPVAMLCV